MCYCVKYVRTVLFKTFYVSQNSVATYFRCNAKYDKDLVTIYCERIFKNRSTFAKE